MTPAVRRHWENCITHLDGDVRGFVADYFGEAHRRCFLVAGAGFDPRAVAVASMLSEVMGPRLNGLLLRENRGGPAASLREAALGHQAVLCHLMPEATVLEVEIFAADGATVSGIRTVERLSGRRWPEDATDVVLDLSALSIGTSFPAAKYLLEECEQRGVAFHLMVTSDPDLDDRIFAEPADNPAPVRGYAEPPAGEGEADLPVARIWLPHLAPRRGTALRKVRSSIADIYKTCPVLPFPARNPRRPDELVTEFAQELREEWQVDPRDVVHASERNPLDTFRTLTTLKSRLDRAMQDIYRPQLVLTPVGSKILAAGALMAAIRHSLAVQHVETLRFDFDPFVAAAPAYGPERIAHVWLHGHVYDAYPDEPSQWNS